MRNLFWIVSVVLLSSGAVQAHDYWLQPDRFFLQVNDTVSVHLFVGHDFADEVERPFQAKPTLRFQLVSQKSTRDLTQAGIEGKKPTATLSLRNPGTHWLLMERDFFQITIEAEKFNRYLKHEKLDAILKARRKLGEEKKPGRERYCRSLKSLLQAGEKSDDTWKRILKQRLEIVPLANPADLKPGGTLRVRILFAGKPLAHVTVFRLSRAGKQVKSSSSQTDKNGVAVIRIGEKGIHLVRLVHMRRCVGDPKADWESFWSAMTFAVR